MGQSRLPQLVPEVGLEPTCLAAADFESSRNPIGEGQTANFATRTERKHTKNLWQATDSHPPTPENENPGALAGATGALNIREWLTWIDHNLKRESAARRFAHSVVGLYPGDRLPMLESAFLFFLPAGAPGPGFGPIMDDAFFRAEMASETERKAYAWAYFHRMSQANQQAFIAKVTGARNV